MTHGDMVRQMDDNQLAWLFWHVSYVASHHCREGKCENCPSTWLCGQVSMLEHLGQDVNENEKATKGADK